MIDFDAIDDDFQYEMNIGKLNMISAFNEAVMNGEIANYNFNYRWEICDVCNGDGGHSRRLGVINRDDWDDEEFGYYMRGGYDITCELCNGSGKVKEIDLDLAPDYVRAWVQSYYDDIYSCAAERRSERMMGA